MSHIHRSFVALSTLLLAIGWHVDTIAGPLTANWSDSSTGVAGFSLERSTGTTGTFSEIATTGAGTTTYTDPTVSGQTTYCYRVRSYNATTYSDYSNVACATTAQALSLTVVKMGVGSGTVISTPAGINCGTSCAASYASGAAVTLTATAATGSTFKGWSGGGCSATASCVVTVSAATTVTATFNAATSAISTVAAAVLPNTRSVQVGSSATAYATIINTGATPALDCAISPATIVPATFAFQSTDPVTNQLTGSPNTPVAIPAGSAQTFVFALTPTAPIAPTEVIFNFYCSNSTPAASVVGVNTLLLSASATPVPDIVALSLTAPNGGILNIPGPTGAAAFSVATMNAGAGGVVTVTADTGGIALPMTLLICQTNPTTAACVSPIGPNVSTTINAGATPTFAVFAMGTGVIPFNPVVNRIFVRFSDASGVIRGATSVAVRTQ